MKTVLRILSAKDGSEYINIVNTYNMTPRKGDSVVYNKNSYIVAYVEFDFDTDTMYLIIK